MALTKKGLGVQQKLRTLTSSKQHWLSGIGFSDLGIKTAV
jgi:hypothetical protein